MMAAVGTLVLPGATEDKIIQSQWTSTLVQVDGQVSEWPAEAMQFEKGVNAQYAFKNDANFLYCVFIFNDPKFMSSVEQSGFAFWINAEGKEKKTHGLRFYRKGVTGDQLIQELEKSGTPVTEERKKEILSKPQYMLFAFDVLDKKGNIVSHAGTETGTYRLARAQKTMVFEFVLPLSLLNDPSAKTPLDTAKPFKLGFEWGGMTEEMRKQKASELGARGSQANSQGAGGDKVNDENEGFRDSSVSLSSMRRGIPKKYDFWLSLQIAPKQ